MNPQNNQTPGFGLPQPAFSVGQSASPQVPQPAQSTDSATAFSIASPQPPLVQAVGGQRVVPVSQSQAPVQATVLPGLADPVRESQIVPAEDDSALDEEWVNKAREIVQRTHADPYLQSKEISKIKAQYIKVRYNKDIKSSEE